MPLSLTNTVRNMVGYQCQYGYFFSHHILRGPWSILGPYLISKEYRWLNHGIINRIMNAFIAHSRVRWIKAQLLPDYGMFILAREFQKYCHHSKHGAFCMHMLRSPASCCVLASARFCTSISIGFLYDHQLMSEASGGTVVCHENLQS